MRLAKSSPSPVPLYFKVMTEIRDGILSGEWRAGSRLPGELDLARRLGVSVITVRQALADLASEGLVRREPARGTFVTWSGPVKQPIDLEIEAASLVRINRAGTSFKVLGVESFLPAEKLRREFDLAAGDSITRITRVRIAYGRPLAFVNSFVPARLLNKTARGRLLRHPLTKIIEDRLGHKVAGLTLVVSAKLADRQVSTHLSIPTGSPVLLVERN